MKKRTAVFIDHESWFYGLLNLHGELPDVDNVLGRIEEENEVLVRRAFGNLPETDNRSGYEKEKLEKYDYHLEYTFEGNVKDDLTDFVLVDGIYRLLMAEPSIEKFIILSGDAHYLQVVRTIKEFGKEVEIWAVAGTLSAVFNEYTHEIIYPTCDDAITKLVIDEVRIQSALDRVVFQRGLVKSVSEKHGIDEALVSREVIVLLSRGVLKELSYFNIRRKKVQSIVVNKDYIGS